MTTKILHIRLRVQIEEPTPPELIETYIKGFMKEPDKAYKRLKEVIPDIDTVIEKIIKPGIRGSKALFKPEAFTRRGTQIKNIPKPTQADMEKWAERWFKKTKHAHRYDSKEYLASIKNMAGLWGEKMTRFVLPFSGYQDKIRGIGPIVARWLTGELTVVKRVSREEIIKGKPIDITPAKAGRGQRGKFRKGVINQIVSSGRQIIEKKYQPSEIVYANEQINQFVTGYATDKFGRFTPGGASHVDFVREYRQLFLEIVVSVS